MRTTRLGAAIVAEAMRQLDIWNTSKCYEVKNAAGKTNNIIRCDTTGDIKNFPYGSRGEPWCAWAVSYIVKNACDTLGVKNLLPISASTLNIYESGQKLGIVDRNIAVGAIAYRAYDKCTGSNPKCGHVSIVVEVTNDKIHTIEGNADDSIKHVIYDHKAFWNNPKNNYSKGHFIIHAETMGGESGFTADNPFAKRYNVDYSGTSSKEAKDDHQQDFAKQSETSVTPGSSSSSGATPTSASPARAKRNYYIRR